MSFELPWAASLLPAPSRRALSLVSKVRGAAVNGERAGQITVCKMQSSRQEQPQQCRESRVESRKDGEGRELASAEEAANRVVEPATGERLPGRSKSYG